jgi:hypothetical protein
MYPFISHPDLLARTSGRESGDVLAHVRASGARQRDHYASQALFRGQAPN